jgi:hypothetical protein
MSVIESRADQIYSRFKEFHAANPQIWELFERFALDVAARGMKTYGAAAITERVRWHVAIDARGADVKINNDFRAYYARMFNAKHPHLDLFNTRVRRSADHAAYRNDLETFVLPPASGEESLLADLRSIA